MSDSSSSGKAKKKDKTVHKRQRAELVTYCFFDQYSRKTLAIL